MVFSKMVKFVLFEFLYFIVLCVEWFLVYWFCVMCGGGEIDWF